RRTIRKIAAYLTLEPVFMAVRSGPFALAHTAPLAREPLFISSAILPLWEQIADHPKEPWWARSSRRHLTKISKPTRIDSPETIVVCSLRDYDVVAELSKGATAMRTKPSGCGS